MDHREAQESLASVTSARLKSFELQGYRQAGSVVAAWGLARLAGFGASQFAPQTAPWIWLIGWASALAWTITRPRAANDLRALATWAVAIVFVTLLLVVIRADLRTAGIVSGLALAASYTTLGIWIGRRFAVLGVLVFLSACIGWWLAPQWLFLALALGGGGALILGGIWLRRP